MATHNVHNGANNLLSAHTAPRPPGGLRDDSFYLARALVELGSWVAGNLPRGKLWKHLAVGRRGAELHRFTADQPPAPGYRGHCCPHGWHNVAWNLCPHCYLTSHPSAASSFIEHGPHCSLDRVNYLCYVKWNALWILRILSCVEILFPSWGWMLKFLRCFL